MKTTNEQSAQPTIPRPELTFDGFGINGPGEYRARLATFSRGIDSALCNKYGPMLAAAPAMLDMLRRQLYNTRGDLEVMEEQGRGKETDYLKHRIEAMRKVILQAEGHA